MGVSVHEAGSDPRIRELEERRPRRGAACGLCGGADETHPTGLPPDPVAGNTRCERDNAPSYQDTAPSGRAWLPGDDAIHMWKSRQSEYPNRWNRFDNR